MLLLYVVKRKLNLIALKSFETPELVTKSIFALVYHNKTYLHFLHLKLASQAWCDKLRGEETGLTRIYIITCYVQPLLC